MRRRMARDPTKDRERPTEIGCCVIGQGRKAEGRGRGHHRTRAKAGMRRTISLPVAICPARGDEKATGRFSPIFLVPRQQNPRRHIEIARQERPHQPSAIRA